MQSIKLERKSAGQPLKLPQNLVFQKVVFKMIDIRQTLRYATYLTSIGWKVERIDGVNYFIKKFPLIGALLKIQRPEKIDFNTVDKLCRKYRIFQVIIEPKNSIQELKIKKVGYKL